MKTSRIITSVYVTLFIFSMLFASCSKAQGKDGGDPTPGRPTASEQSGREVLLAYDFTNDIDSQVLIDMRRASPRTDRLIGIKALGAVSRHPKDERILGMKLVGNDNWWVLDQTLMKVVTYVARNESLPASAVDLFPELADEEGIAKFNAMYPTQRMVTYGPGVNFATSKFFTDFGDPTWRPGGLYFDILKKNDNCRYVYDGNEMVFGGIENEDVPDGALYFKVFSAAEGEVLFEDFVTFATSS